MPEPYNLTNVTSGDNVLGLFKSANQMTDSTFGIVILLMVALLVYMRLKGYNSESALIAAMFITTLLSIFLFLMGMVTQVVLMVCIILFAITVLIKFLFKD